MPYNKYICPDGETCPIESCLKGCRIPDMFEANRCLSDRTLMAISEQREWKGTPSTTQLLNGTREEYLKLTKNFAINPQDSAFAIFGTGCHAFLEGFLENDKMIAEKRLVDPTGTYTGQFDCYDGKRQILYDVKTYGSFKTAHAMGLVKHKEPVLDSEGNQLKYRNGKKRYKTYFTRGVREIHDVAIQLNAYRIMVENIGLPVKDMQVEIFTRDAGTFSARDRGVMTNMQLIRINRISDVWIQKYMLTKAYRLKRALKTRTLPPPCSYRECWGKRKCKDYCAVWQFCDVGRKVHK